MTLSRKHIRREVAAILRGKTIAGDRVFTNRKERLWHEELPALVVYSMEENGIEILNDAPREYLRPLELAIELFTEEDATDVATSADLGFVDDQVDDFCQQVEDLLLPALHLPDDLHDDLLLDAARSALLRVELGFDAQGRQLAGSARLVFAIAYRTTVDETNAEEVSGMKDAAVQWDFPPPDGTFEATDDFQLPQP